MYLHYRAYSPHAHDHFYTVSKTEQDNAVTNLGYSDEGIACYVYDPSAPVRANRGALYRMFLPRTGDHFYTTSLAERVNAINNIGYRDEGVIGDVFFAQDDLGTVALYRAYAPSNGDHFYTTSKPEHDNAVANLGYNDEGIACYVHESSAPDRLPLYRAFKRYGARVRLHLKIVQVYVSEGVSCYVFLGAGANRDALYRAYKPQNGDHFYTTSKAEHDNAVANLGYNDEGVACWVPNAAGPGIAPLYRAYHPQTGDHFYTTSKPEHDNAVANLGYNDEGVACEIYLTAQAGIGPLYRLFNAQTGDHFYTTNGLERNIAEQNVGPNVPLSTTTASMQNAYDQASIKVVIVSTQFISVPPEVDLNVGQCVAGNTTSQQDALFGHRDYVGPNEITIYFVRTSIPPLNGCAAYPPGHPGAIVTQGASQWTMAHETGHVLGLSHVAGENCGQPGYVPTRLMTGCGTGRIVANPPVLITSEIQTMQQSPYLTDI
jgi:hypothetical protein